MRVRHALRILVVQPVLLTTTALACTTEHPGTGDILDPVATLMCDPTMCTGGLTLDQHQPVIEDGFGYAFAIGSVTGSIVAQTFVPSGTRLGAVSVSVRCSPGTSLIVEIREMSGGLPTGTVLGDATVPDSDLADNTVPWTFSDIDVRALMGRFIRLMPGTKYAIVLQTSAGGSCGAVPGPSGDSYLPGEGWGISAAEPGAVWVRTNTATGNPDDLPFRTYSK